jgi:hypothetical protein
VPDNVVNRRPQGQKGVMMCLGEISSELVKVNRRILVNNHDSNPCRRRY